MNSHWKRYLALSMPIVMSFLGTEAPGSSLFPKCREVEFPIASLRPGDLGPYAFDFGPAGGHVEGGFVEVSKGTVYSQERGYGWVVAPLWEPTVGWGISFLAEDAASADQPAKFRVDCPPGNYRIFAVAGPVGWSHTNILVEGKVCAVLRTFRNTPQMRSAAFEVKTTQPYLELTIQTDTSWSLCGLVVYPVGAGERIESALKTVVQGLELGSPQFLKDKQVKLFVLEDPTPVPASDAPAKERGFLLSTVPIASNLPPTIKPTKDQICKNLPTMEIARNERQTQRVRLWALRKLQDVRLDPGKPLHIADGKTLTVAITRLDYQWRPQLLIDDERGSCFFDPDPNFIQYPTKMERQGTSPWGTDGTGALNMVPFHVEAQRAQEFCVTVRVPKDAAPGDYNGTLVLQANGNKSEIPYRVQVLPFTLIDKGLPEYRFFANMDEALCSPHPNVARAATDYLRKELRFMNDWGAGQWATNYYHLTQRDHPEQSPDPLFAKFMTIAHEEDMLRGKFYYMWWTSWQGIFTETTGKPLVNWPSMPELYQRLDTNPAYKLFRDKMTTEIKMIKSEFQNRGWPEPLFGPMDEPTSRTAPLLEALSNIIHKAGGKVSTQTPNGETDLKWLKVVDHPINYQEWFNRKRSLELHQRGIPNQLWRGCWGHYLMRGLGRGESGLFGLYSQADAIQYAFWWAPRINPESDIDNIGDFAVEMTACYQRDQGPISSMFTEVLRTARDDARYALTLREMARKLDQDYEKRPLAREYKAQLDQMLNGMVGPPGTLLKEKTAAQINWDAKRQKIKAMILKLAK